MRTASINEITLTLYQEGFRSAEDVSSAAASDLSELDGISEEKAGKIIESAITVAAQEKAEREEKQAAEKKASEENAEAAQAADAQAADAQPASEGEPAEEVPGEQVDGEA